MSIDERFRPEAFDEVGPDQDPLEPSPLQRDLQEQVMAELNGPVADRLAEIVRQLNGVGHDLRLYNTPEPGDIAYRDDSEHEGRYSCKLRLGIDLDIVAL